MELLIYYFTAVDRCSLLFSLFLLLGSILLTISHHILKRKNANAPTEEFPIEKRSLFIWRLLCLLPIPFAAIHFFIYRLRGLPAHTFVLYGNIYITSLLLALWQFLYRRKHSYRIMAIAVNFCAALGLLTFFSVHSAVFASVNNYTAQSYTKSFHSTIHAMQREYVLSEWKEIDYDALERDIMPMVESAEKKQDHIDYGIALMTYAYRFYDGHVAFEAMNDTDTEVLCERLAGNDYGFSLITLDDGSTIAVLSDSDCKAYAAGIKDGTIITRWNGVPIKNALKDIECIYPELLTFPVADNEALVKPLFLAGKGPDEIEVSFLDTDNSEKTVSLQCIGSYRERLELALSRFYHSDIEDENFSCKMLSKNCGYLRISEESYDTFSDSMASIKGEYPEVTEMLDEKLQTLRDSGMENLIIDLRGNKGGSAFICPAVASLFAKESYFASRIAKYENGKSIPMNTKIVVEANGKYADIKTAVLVNAECCSSGDGLADNLSRLPNVTLMGITSSNGIDQTTGGYCFTTDGDYVIKYPIILSLDENGDPHIDTRADRVSRVPLDEHIPITKEAALTIFSGKGDYELDYVLRKLSAE